MRGDKHLFSSVPLFIASPRSCLVPRGRRCNRVYIAKYSFSSWGQAIMSCRASCPLHHPGYGEDVCRHDYLWVAHFKHLGQCYVVYDCCGKSAYIIYATVSGLRQADLNVVPWNFSRCFPVCCACRVKKHCPLCCMWMFFSYLCTPLRRKSGRWKARTNGEEKSFIFFLQVIKSFLPLQPGSEGTEKHWRIREEGGKDEEKTGKKYFHFLFGEEKKFPTFAVPNEGELTDGVRRQVKKDWNDGGQTEIGTLRRPVGTQAEIATYRSPRGKIGKFIKEISFTKAQRGENVYYKVHIAKLFSLGRFLQTIQSRTDNQF